VCRTKIAATEIRAKEKVPCVCIQERVEHKELHSH